MNRTHLFGALILIIVLTLIGIWKHAPFTAKMSTVVEAPSPTPSPTPVPEPTSPESTTSTTESTSSPSPEVTPATLSPLVAETPLPLYTKDSLAQYDGTDPNLPIYIAFEGNVYDVTAGREYYEPGGAYHFLAGTDGTTLLRTIGGGIIKQKYSVVGTFQE